MNPVIRGVKNALRSPMRTGAIISMIAISITLVMSMLVARASILSKVDDIKATTGTAITITLAGVRGFAGGGDPQSTATSGQSMTPPEGGPAGGMSPRTTVTGTTDQNSIQSDGGTLTITSGEGIDASGSSYTALAGTTLAEKNSLSAGSTFTMYGKTFTVSGIYSTDNQFQDSGIVIPLATLQALTDQAGAVTSVTATIDTSEHVESTVSALKTAFGDSADIISQIEQAKSTISSLEGIASLALVGVIGSAISGAVIILLAMVIIVRERRREIGVMKAIGGRNKSIISQFMSEALTITFAGGIIGVVLGIAVSGPITSSLASNASSTAQSSEQSSTPGSGTQPPRGTMRAGGPDRRIEQTVTSITSTVSTQTISLAVVLLIIIAIVGSALPAWIITTIKPAEVLRSE